MIRVMYLSNARRRMTHGELMDLLAGARLRNEQHGVTGLLLYDAGSFAQILEGEEEVIEQLLANIAADPRHDEVRLVSEGRIDQWYFEGWSMDWANLDRHDAPAHAELRHYLQQHPIADRSAVYGALRTFVDAHTRHARPAAPRPEWPPYQTPVPRPRRFAPPSGG